MRSLTLIGLYLAAIVAANLLVAAFGPAVSIGCAFLFIGLDLTSRDRLHEAWHGRGLTSKMGMLIATGSCLSYAVNPASGPIALASFVAFAASATVDALSYHALRQRAYLVKVNGSNIVSAAVDSVLFPWIAFHAFLPWIILGQFVAKVLGGLAWSVLLARHADERSLV